MKLKPRHKQKDGKAWIEVRVRTTQQLFDARDPAPFHERDLDDNFVEYLMSCASEFSVKIPLKISIYIEEPKSSGLDPAVLRDAIRSYFLYKIELTRGTLKTFLKRAQIFLGIGLFTLFICLSVAQALRYQAHEGILLILTEGLVIFGWVSVWKPIELMMFDWIPIMEEVRMLKKISSSDIEIHYGTK